MIKRDFKIHKSLYLLAIPGIAYYVIFHYVPMYGATIAFKDFSPLRGILGSPWVGFIHFESFFRSYYFWRLIRNTLLLNFYNLLFGFPAPIILALLLNEVRVQAFKKTVQTISYLPHFISTVVICGMIVDFTSSRGVIVDLIAAVGGERANLLARAEYFRMIYVSSGIWQQVGWGTIIYLAALTNVDPQLYDAAGIDGAGRFKQMLHVTLPGIMPTVVILLILRIGRIMSIGFEKIILLYSPLIYETADVIQTFVYRKGLLENNFSYSAAIGLFNSIINLSMLVFANWLSRRVNETSLW